MRGFDIAARARLADWTAADRQPVADVRVGHQRRFDRHPHPARLPHLGMRGVIDPLGAPGFVGDRCASGELAVFNHGGGQGAQMVVVRVCFRMIQHGLDPRFQFLAARSAGLDQAGNGRDGLLDAVFGHAQLDQLPTMLRDVAADEAGRARNGNVHTFSFPWRYDISRGRHKRINLPRVSAASWLHVAIGNSTCASAAVGSRSGLPVSS